MNTSKASSFRLYRAPLGALVAALVTFTPAQLLANDERVSFSSNAYVEVGDVELARPPKFARDATTTVYPFGPAAPKSKTVSTFGAAKPKASYAGPDFLLGYEVRASAPSDLTVYPGKAVVEDNSENGKNAVQDAISITAQALWYDTNTYSVALAVVFPTKTFVLDRLAYSTSNWTLSKNQYNEKLRHRWIVQTGGKYYVNSSFLGRTGRSSSDAPVDVIASERSGSLKDTWVAYDPAVSLFADLNAKPVKLGAALDKVTAVGLYIDALDFKGSGTNERQWKFKLISFVASGFVD